MRQTAKKNDGGMYALRGYAFQFDSSLISLFEGGENDKKISFEYRQDFSSEEFCHQVKYRSSKYSNSKIRNAVEQLFNEFCDQPQKKYILYCHFSDKSELTKKLSVEDLNIILAEKSSKYTDEQKKDFVRQFLIKFTSDFQKHFKKLIKLICIRYACTENEAVIKHALMRSHILDLTLFRSPNKRKISLSSLDSVLDDASKIVFSESYAKYLGYNKYLGMVKRELFTFTAANVENHERLFIVDGSKANEVDLVKVISTISKRYYRKLKSPAPYIYIRNTESLNKIKQRLVDKGVAFTDGTRFSGDKFRIEDIKSDAPIGVDVTLKIVDASTVERILKKIDFDDVYEFYVNLPLENNVLQKLDCSRSHIKLDKVSEVMKLMK